MIKVNFIFVSPLEVVQKVYTKSFVHARIQLYHIYKNLGESLPWHFLHHGFISYLLVKNEIQLQTAFLFDNLYPSHVAVWRDVSTTCLCLVVSSSVLFSEKREQSLIKKMIHTTGFYTTRFDETGYPLC